MSLATRCFGIVLVGAATCSAVLGQDKNDPLAAVLHDNARVAIVPYNQQSEAQVGAIVVLGFKGQTPIIRRASADVPAAKDDEMVLHGEDMARIKSANGEAKLFSFDFGGKFNNYSTLSFNTMQLPGKKVEYDDLLDVLKPGSPTDVMLRRDYVNPNPSKLGEINYAAKALYIISKVFTSTGVEITSTSGTDIGLTSGQTIPACPDLPKTPDDKQKPDPNAKPTPAVDNKGADQPPAKPADKKNDQPAQNAAQDPKQNAPKTPTDKKENGGSVDVNIGGVKLDANVGGGDNQPATKGAADKASAGIKIDSPSGSVLVCKKDSYHIVLTTDHPIPIGMLVYQITLKAPLGQKGTVATDTWHLDSATPLFVSSK